MTHPAALPLEVESWRPIPGVSGYEASNLGRVRSTRRKQPKILRATAGPCGFRTVQVSALIGGGTCRRVGSLIALAWVGPRPKGAEVRRLDGDPLNDKADNLAYGTLQEACTDHAARAEREGERGAPKRCAYGHRLADTWLGNWGDRLCPDCKLEENRKTKRKAQNRAYYLAHRAPKPLVSPCVDCGADVHQNGGPGVFKRCEPCRVKASTAATCRYRAKSRKPSRVSRCIDCGVSIRNTGPGPMAQRCVPHKKLAQRAASERYERKTRRASGRRRAHRLPDTDHLPETGRHGVWAAHSFDTTTKETR